MSSVLDKGNFPNNAKGEMRNDLVGSASEIYARNVEGTVLEFGSSFDEASIRAVRKGYEKSKLYKKFIESESKKFRHSLSAARKEPAKQLNKSQSKKRNQDSQHHMNTFQSPTRNTKPIAFTLSNLNPIKDNELFTRQLALQLEIQTKRNKDLEAVVRAQAQKATTIIESLRKNAEEEIAELSCKLERSEKMNRELKCYIEEREAKELVKKNVGNSGSVKGRNEEIIKLKKQFDQLSDEFVIYKEASSKMKSDHLALVQRSNELEQEKENLAQTVNAISNTKEIIEAAAEELKKENFNLKQTIAEFDKEKTSLTIKLDKADRDYNCLLYTSDAADE
eukprot:TRINITY_DN7964_c0_g1_i3.p1 TRINITY_DN7964_c0_g1~~TRINITY_DN7964_c0_g1_i3.p1  ORF type:complete len:336 (-),score=79.84 TRINITY_DN7964_c0_g1_i3:57-1064(-)